MNGLGFWITVALMGIGAVALLLPLVTGVADEDDPEPTEHGVDEP